MVPDDTAHTSAHGSALAGVMARGLLYLLLAFVALELVIGNSGALKQLLDEPFGGVLVVLIGVGFLAFGTYSVARAWTNRHAVGA
jgi:hypothetical protein